MKDIVLNKVAQIEEGALSEVEKYLMGVFRGEIMFEAEIWRAVSLSYEAKMTATTQIKNEVIAEDRRILEEKQINAIKEELEKMVEGSDDDRN